MHADWEHPFDNQPYIKESDKTYQDDVECVAIICTGLKTITNVLQLYAVDCDCHTSFSILSIHPLCSAVFAPISAWTIKDQTTPSAPLNGTAVDYQEIWAPLMVACLAVKKQDHLWVLLISFVIMWLSAVLQLNRKRIPQFAKKLVRNNFWIAHYLRHHWRCSLRLNRLIRITFREFEHRLMWFEDSIALSTTWS